MQVALLLLLSQTMSFDVIVMALALAPLIYIGTTIGIRIGDRFSKELLNRAALAVLILVALNAIF